MKHCFGVEAPRSGGGKPHPFSLVGVEAQEKIIWGIYYVQEGIREYGSKNQDKIKVL